MPTFARQVTRLFICATRGLQRLADAEIVARAANEGRCIITFDLDFAHLLALQRLAQPSVVLLRLSTFTTDEVNRLLADLLERWRSDLEAGAIVVVDPKRVRVRALPVW